MQVAIALETIKIMNPKLAKMIIMSITFVTMFRCLKDENSEHSQEEIDYNCKLALIGMFIIILIPNILIEYIAVAVIKYLLIKLNLPFFPVLTPFLVWVTTLMVAMVFEITIQIIIRYIKRIKYS